MTLIEIIQDLKIKEEEEMEKWNPGEHFILGAHSHGHVLDTVVSDNCITY